MNHEHDPSSSEFDSSSAESNVQPSADAESDPPPTESPEPIALTPKMRADFERQVAEEENQARTAIQRGVNWAKKEEAHEHDPKRLAHPEPIAPLPAARKSLQRLGVEMQQLDEDIWFLDQLHETKKWSGRSRLGGYGNKVSMLVKTLRRGHRACGASPELAEVAAELDRHFLSLTKLHEDFYTSGELRHADYQEWCAEVMEVVNAEPLSLRLVPPWR